LVISNNFFDLFYVFVEFCYARTTWMFVIIYLSPSLTKPFMPLKNSGDMVTSPYTLVNSLKYFVGDFFNLTRNFILTSCLIFKLNIIPKNSGRSWRHSEAESWVQEESYFTTAAADTCQPRQSLNDHHCHLSCTCIVKLLLLNMFSYHRYYIL